MAKGKKKKSVAEQTVTQHHSNKSTLVTFIHDCGDGTVTECHRDLPDVPRKGDQVHCEQLCEEVLTVESVCWCLSGECLSAKVVLA